MEGRVAIRGRPVVAAGAAIHGAIVAAARAAVAAASLVATMCLPVAVAAVEGANGYHAEEEHLLVEALTRLRGSRLDDALSSIQTLVDKRPNFRLAQLVYGDVLLAKAGRIHEFGGNGAGPAAGVAGLREEARNRLTHHLAAPPAGMLPDALLQVPAGRSHVLVADLSRNRLFVFANRDGDLALTADYYGAIGKAGAVKVIEGDDRTPVGVYFITRFIDGDDLPPLYGAGAFPLDYPNPWDRRQGRTGHGIWLHGVPVDTYSRPPRSSEGCITLANHDLLQLRRWVEVGKTPVVIAERLNWVAAEEMNALRRQLTGHLERWRRDWESRDPERYASHYAEDFTAPDKDYAQWLGHKARVNARKDFIRVALEHVAMFRDPADPDLVLVTFHQDYDSSNYRGEMAKRQYWRRQPDGAWRIVYEGPA